MFVDGFFQNSMMFWRVWFSFLRRLIYETRESAESPQRSKRLSINVTVRRFGM